MNPASTPEPNNTSQPADLPPIAAGMAQSSLSGQAPIAAGAGTGTIGQQAEALVHQYEQDPYRLQSALQQLKTQYLAEQFHINVNAVEE